ncbi:GNAT family N-acetyltransferase [Promicromonospora thailandica]|uniref:Acetyltransferase (GNAT) family protein n=1 Tax=Promicromonospora thailandica TaxID=765201 RepID=A0A9X2G1U2_9MICO|nr:GNAT family N-acetyltransferase [Promicromonospora thailandica]MCP2265495.1 Acetyltransferase (GNAT) family protein [Promicromonospora thailandica]
MAERDGLALAELPAAVRARAARKLTVPPLAWIVARDAVDGLAGFGVVLPPGTSGDATDPADGAYLALLAVAPSARGSGLGGRLLDAVTHAVRAAGVTSVFLNVLGSNTPARRLYESRGWTSSGRPTRRTDTGQPVLRYTMTF